MLPKIDCINTTYMVMHHAFLPSSLVSYMKGKCYSIRDLSHVALQALQCLVSILRSLVEWYTVSTPVVAANDSAPALDSSLRPDWGPLTSIGGQEEPAAEPAMDGPDTAADTDEPLPGWCPMRSDWQKPGDVTSLIGAALHGKCLHVLAYTQLLLGRAKMQHHS